MPLDPVLVIAAVLLLITTTTTILYYRRIKRASKAYDEARNAVSDVVFSIDKQLQAHESQLEKTNLKIDTLASRNEKLSRHLEEQQNRFANSFVDLTQKLEHLPDVETLRQDLADVKATLGDLAKVQEELKQQAVAPPEAQIETAIPIKRERALAPLTETELHVLEIIAASGEKTAPEVRAMIKLTREHTARLLKKLYEEGYLERRSEKAPYAYRVKEEMLRILKKNEASNAQ